MGSKTINFDVWNDIDKATYLAADRNNPARKAAAEFIEAFAEDKKEAATLLEVGPSTGIDYDLFFKDLTRRGLVKYDAVDGSEKMVKHLLGTFPSLADFEDSQSLIYCESFNDFARRMKAKRQQWDVVYAKAILESQPDPFTVLEGFFALAKHMVVVNFFRPPANEERDTDLQDDGKGHISARLLAPLVRETGIKAGWFEPAITNFPGKPGNQIWTWRKALPPKTAPKTLAKKTPKK